MSETGAKPARRKIWKYLLWLMLAGSGDRWPWAGTAPRIPFGPWCAQRLIATLERITGGRVELGSIHAVPFHFQVEVRDLTIHGREQPGEVPYAHVNSLMAQIKIWSILRTEIGLNYIILDHPVIHIILYPDGTTNQPEPKVKQVSTKKPLERFLRSPSLAWKFAPRELIWGDRKLPLDFSASTFPPT